MVKKISSQFPGRLAVAMRLRVPRTGRRSLRSRSEVQDHRAPGAVHLAEHRRGEDFAARVHPQSMLEHGAALDRILRRQKLFYRFVRFNSNNWLWELDSDFKDIFYWYCGTCCCFLGGKHDGDTVEHFTPARRLLRTRRRWKFIFEQIFLLCILSSVYGENVIRACNDVHGNDYIDLIYIWGLTRRERFFPFFRWCH